MFKFQFLARGGVMAFAFAAGGAPAATLEPVSMADLVRIDALGFSCVEEDNLEAAFAATGKKDGVVPQSCLPKPCDRLLDADQLSEYLGRNPTDEKWDEYVSRYAEYCVAETGGPWPDDVLFANASDGIGDFWSDLLTPLNSGVGSDIFTLAGSDTGVVPSGSTFTRVADASTTQTPGVIRPPRLPAPAGPTTTETIPRVPTPASPVITPDSPVIVLPSPVPLPGSMALLIGGLGAAWAGRRFAKGRAVV